MSIKLDIYKEDLYAILGVSEDALVKEITKSYRKQALKCHPDKNPDNPKAAEQFHKLTYALEVLTDVAAKAAYDKVLKARKAADIRKNQYDSQRKKFKDDLDARERAARENKEDTVDAAKKLQAEIDRLRKEGNRILQETQEQLRKDLQDKLQTTNDDNSNNDDLDNTTKIKAKWKIKKDGQTRDEGYTREELKSMFEQYGEVINLVMSVKKSGTSIIEFASTDVAKRALENVKGKSDFPLTLAWLSRQPPGNNVNSNGDNRTTTSSTATGTKFPSFSQPTFGAPVTVGNRDYESLVLMRMRQAEERKRLIEQMMKEEECGS